MTNGSSTVKRQRRADAALDETHEAAAEAACDLDRDFARRHPEADSYLRPALLHELCPPGEPCISWAGSVFVRFVAPGVRLRGAV
jgi:hypothetical protein